MKKLSILVVALGLIIFAVAIDAKAQTDSVSVTVTISQNLSVDVNPPSWPIGTISQASFADTVSAGTVPFSGNEFTALNNGNLDENFTITVGNSASWTFVDNEGAEDEFAMDISTAGDTPSWNEILAGAGYEFASSIGASSSQAFDLYFYAPTTTSVGGVLQTIAVTVTASAS